MFGTLLSDWGVVFVCAKDSPQKSIIETIHKIIFFMVIFLDLNLFLHSGNTFTPRNSATSKQPENLSKQFKNIIKPVNLSNLKIGSIKLLSD